MPKIQSLKERNIKKKGKGQGDEGGIFSTYFLKFFSIVILHRILGKNCTRHLASVTKWGLTRLKMLSFVNLCASADVACLGELSVFQEMGETC